MFLTGFARVLAFSYLYAPVPPLFPGSTKERPGGFGFSESQCFEIVIRPGILFRSPAEMIIPQPDGFSDEISIFSSLSPSLVPTLEVIGG